MKKQYGPKTGKEVFFASKNKGKITGVDAKTKDSSRQDKIDQILKSGSPVEKAKVQEMLDLERRISDIEKKPWSQELENREWKPLVDKRNQIERELKIPNFFSGFLRKG